MTAAEEEKNALTTALRRLIRTLRKEQGLTQEELAQRAGASPCVVSLAESEDKHVTLDTLLRLVFALGAGRSQIADALLEDLPETRLLSWPGPSLYRSRREKLAGRELFP